MPTPNEIARAIACDIGIEAGHRYALQIAAANGADSADYATAADILAPYVPCGTCDRLPVDGPCGCSARPWPGSGGYLACGQCGKPLDRPSLTFCTVACAQQYARLNSWQNQ